MKRRRDRRSDLLPALAISFALGGVAGWWLRSGAPLPAGAGEGTPRAAPTSPSGSPQPADRSSLRGDRGGEVAEGRAPDVAATTGEPLIGPEPSSAANAISELRRHNLRLPLEGADIERMKGGFAEQRSGGARRHEAVDILARRHTPVYAVDDGSIARLYFSKAGGITIYQLDPSGRFCYYYAHLERYAPGLRERQRVSRGDVLGYVGTSGNAPPNTPHLHFAVFELDDDRQWWKGRALDPYLVFSNSS